MRYFHGGLRPQRLGDVEKRVGCKAVSVELLTGWSGPMIRVWPLLGTGDGSVSRLDAGYRRAIQGLRQGEGTSPRGL